MRFYSAPTAAAALLLAACSNSSKLQDTTSHGTAGANSDTAAISAARAEPATRAAALRK